MKKIVLLCAFVGLISFSCQNDKKADKNDKNKTELVLNNGEKWHANKETTEGVEKMIAIVDHHRTRSLRDFNEMGKAFTEVQDYIIQKCTMKGEAHENLHKWLEPLIKNIKSLREAESVEDAQVALKAIINQLGLYKKYFE